MQHVQRSRQGGGPCEQRRALARALLVAGIDADGQHAAGGEQLHRLRDGGERRFHACSHGVLRARQPAEVEDDGVCARRRQFRHALVPGAEERGAGKQPLSGEALARALHGLFLHVEAENMPRLAHQRAESLGVVAVAEGGVDGRGAFVQGVEYKALRPAASAAEI